MLDERVEVGARLFASVGVGVIVRDHGDGAAAKLGALFRPPLRIILINGTMEG